MFCNGFASRNLGVPATALEKWAAAEGHFKEAIEDNCRIGARPWLALEPAWLRPDAHAPAGGDRDEARVLLERLPREAARLAV
jgi:hypothetical protein